MSAAQFLRVRFVSVLLAFVALGFLVPGVELVPAPVMMLFLATMIFVSSFQISLEEVRRISPWNSVIFYVLRYPVLAGLLWALTNQLYPSLAMAVMLLTLAPAGVASPGVSSMYCGNVSLSVMIVVISAFLAPFLIPVVLQVFVARQVDLDVWSVFRTLMVSVFFPMVIHVPLRRHRIAGWLRTNDSLFVVPSVGILVMIVVSKQKTFILEHAGESAGFIAISVGLFLLYYLFGWFLFVRASERDRVSYALGSGVNNTGIVIVLAYLYFPPLVSTFIITAEFAWVAGMVVFRRYLASVRDSTNVSLPAG